MKKGIVVIALLITFAVVLAVPEDVVITLTIPAAKVLDFREGFLRAKPIHGDYTEKEWVTKVAKDYIRSIYERGKKLLAADAVVTDPNILQ